jgi:hypothetical protein
MPSNITSSAPAEATAAEAAATKELDAMKTAAHALADLPREAKQRALHWLNGHLFAMPDTTHPY